MSNGLASPEMRAPRAERIPGSELRVSHELEKKVDEAFLGKGSMGLFEDMGEHVPDKGGNALAIYRNWQIARQRCSNDAFDPKPDLENRAIRTKDDNSIAENGVFNLKEKGVGDFRDSVPLTIEALREIRNMKLPEDASSEMKAWQERAGEYLEVLEPAVCVQIIGEEGKAVKSYTLDEWENLSELEIDNLTQEGGVKYAFDYTEESKMVEEKVPEETIADEASEKILEKAKVFFEAGKYDDLLAMIPAVAGKSAKAKLEALETMKAQASGAEAEALGELINGLREQAKAEVEGDLILLTAQEEESLLVDTFKELYKTNPEQAVLLSLQKRRVDAVEYKVRRLAEGANLVEVEAEIARFQAGTEFLQARVAEVVGDLNPFVPEHLLQIFNLEPNETNLKKAKEAIDGFNKLLDQTLEEKTPIRKNIKDYLKLLLVFSLLSSQGMLMVTGSEEGES